jgi:hypothetical protein
MFVGWRASDASTEASELLVGVFDRLLGFVENSAVVAQRPIAAE